MVQIGMFPPHESGTPSMEGTEEEEGEIRVTRNDVGYRRERYSASSYTSSFAMRTLDGSQLVDPNGYLPASAPPDTLTIPSTRNGKTRTAFLPRVRSLKLRMRW